MSDKRKLIKETLGIDADPKLFPWITGLSDKAIRKLKRKKKDNK